MESIAGKLHRTRTGARPEGTLFVSVIVPVYNHSSALLILLWALAEQDYPFDAFEVLIIDNASEEPICLPNDLPFEVRLFQEERPGAYAARNCGVRAARGAVLAFTDADCIPQPDWLSAAVARIRAANELIMLGGRVEVFGQGRAASASQWHSVINDLQQAHYVSKFHFAATANMITTHAVFERIGGFDAELFSGGDWEWGQRAWSSGIRQLYSADVVVRHPARASWQALLGRTLRITGGHYTLKRRTGRPVPAMVQLIARMCLGSCRRVWQDPRVPTLACRLRASGLDVALRFLQLGELARLCLGGRPRRH